MRDERLHRDSGTSRASLKSAPGTSEIARDNEKRLASRRLTALLAVEQQLADHPTEAPILLADLLNRDLDAYAHRRRVLMGALGLDVAAFVVVLGAQVAMPNTDVTGSGLSLVGPAILSGMMVLAWYLWNRGCVTRMHNTICLLEAHPSAAAAGSLLRAYRCAEPEVAFDAADLACTLLPTLSSAESAGLVSNWRRDVVQALRSPNSKLSVEAVRLVERAGDVSYAPEVKKLAAYPYWVTGAGNLLDATRSCLDTLAIAGEHRTVR